ncbi:MULTISPECIES: hypothetical protein [Stenotrophomonas]|uniref:hypothetical protein n=1 Tax=Stenotrophomonas TaxID=40323 RepID=UPI000872BE2C|nr:MULTISPECIES: hypothetical protein [Stenotrophomonas]OEZ02412.1 hypothetical protein BIY45_00990 [Stenotrophomonas sp. BIIR7]
MESSELAVDRTLYSDEEVVRAAHRLSGMCHVELITRSEALVVVVRAPEGQTLRRDLKSRFYSDLVDEKLRSLVRVETQGLHQELVRAALAQAMPRSVAGS